MLGLHDGSLARGYHVFFYDFLCCCHSPVLSNLRQEPDELNDQSNNDLTGRIKFRCNIVQSCAIPSRIGTSLARCIFFFRASPSRAWLRRTLRERERDVYTDDWVHEQNHRSADKQHCPYDQPRAFVVPEVSLTPVYSKWFAHMGIRRNFATDVGYFYSSF